ncbi:MAG: maleylpyruvate isomerase N-terminal domain-containing protein [Acidimicrobiales bacterium]|jgi:uncharacterized protein (TIGR03083 family)
MEGSSVEAFRLASRFLVQAVQAVPESKWHSTGLGNWDMRELVAHANRAHTTIEDYLFRPRSPEPPDSGYFSEAAVAERGREAVAALGESPAVTVAAKSDEVIALVEMTSPDATIGSPAGTMTLSAYLPSRTAELTIHGLDIVHALEVELPAPSPALQESLAAVTRLSVAKGKGELVLLALAGRRELPPHFSVY